MNEIQKISSDSLEYNSDIKIGYLIQHINKGKITLWNKPWHNEGLNSPMRRSRIWYGIDSVNVTGNLFSKGRELTDEEKCLLGLVLDIEETVTYNPITYESNRKAKIIKVFMHDDSSIWYFYLLEKI